MELLIFILVIAGIIIVFNIFVWFIELIENTKLSLHFGNDIENLSDRLENLQISDAKKEFDAMKSEAVSSMGSLVGPDGKSINICPRCGNTMHAQVSYNGIHVSCSKKHCYYSESIKATDDNLKKLTII